MDKISDFWIQKFVEREDAIRSSANRFKIPVEFLVAIISQESAFFDDKYSFRYEPYFDYSYISVKKNLLNNEPYKFYAFPDGARITDGAIAILKGQLNFGTEDPRNVTISKLISLNPKQNWTAPPKDFIAQTLIASSYGAMQIMYSTALNLGFRGDPWNLYDVETNLCWGCKLLQSFWKKYANENDVVAAYNQGNNRKNSDGKYRNQFYVDKVLVYKELWQKFFYRDADKRGKNLMRGVKKEDL